MHKSNQPLTPKQERIIQAELAEEQRQAAQSSPVRFTWADLRDWLMLPEVPSHYEVSGA